MRAPCGAAGPPCLQGAGSGPAPPAVDGGLTAPLPPETRTPGRRSRSGLYAHRASGIAERYAQTANHIKPVDGDVRIPLPPSGGSARRAPQTRAFHRSARSRYPAAAPVPRFSPASPEKHPAGPAKRRRDILEEEDRAGPVLRLRCQRVCRPAPSGRCARRAGPPRPAPLPGSVRNRGRAHRGGHPPDSRKWAGGRSSFRAPLPAPQPLHQRPAEPADGVGMQALGIGQGGEEVGAVKRG